MNHSDTTSIGEPNWDLILANRGLIAKELGELAASLPEARHQLRGIQRWFAGSDNIESAFRRCDVLPFCLALELETESLKSKDVIAHKVLNAFCSVGKDTATSRQLLKLLLYPLLLLIVFAMILICFSIFVSPIFETMFAEFGIELPYFTRLVLGAVETIRQYWWLSIVVPALLIISIWMMDRLTVDSRPGNMNFIDQKTIGDRTALGNWSWHLAHLLKSGIEEDEAVLLAGESSGKSWVNTLSRNWGSSFLDEYGDRIDSKSANKIAADKTVPDTTAESQSIAWQPEMAQVADDQTSVSTATEIPTHAPPVISRDTFYPGERFGFLNSVMALPASPAKIEMLKEVAYYYWDRSSNASSWWIYLVNLAIFLAIVFFVFAVVMALFMPLIAIVSGLTSSKW